VILGPFAIAMIDRWNRQKTMIVSDLCRAVLVSLFPLFLIYEGHHYVVYTLVFFIGTFSALFAPSRLAIMPALVPGILLLSANAIASQAGTVASLIAMPIGERIIHFVGVKAAFWINVATYLISAFFIWRLRPTITDAEAERLQKVHHPVQDLKLGLKYTVHNQPVLFYVLFTVFTQAMVAIFFVTFLEYGSTIFRPADLPLGVPVPEEQTRSMLRGTMMLFGALALGMVCAALWLGRFARIAEKFLFPSWMMCLAGLAIAVLGKVSNPWIAGVAIFVVGLPALATMAPVDTFLQKRVPEEIRGRVFAVRGVLVGMVFLFWLQLSKALVNQFGVFKVFFWLGIGALIFGILSAAIAAQIRARAKLA
jgi:MFS family permease